jgi:hypothetical protein
MMTRFYVADPPCLQSPTASLQAPYSSDPQLAAVTGITVAAQEKNISAQYIYIYIYIYSGFTERAQK